MTSRVLSIAREFSPFPAGRKRSDGPATGEKFREDLLVPLLRNGTHVTLDIDGVEGLPSSFLEEIFGGLVRAGFDVQQLKSAIDFKATEPDLAMYPDLAWRFAAEAQLLH